MHIPEAVRLRFEEWERDGRPIQYSSPIDRDKWEEIGLSQRVKTFLDGMPKVCCEDGSESTMISREAAVAFTANAHESPEYAIDAHTVCYMWGKGLNGLGPTHLKKSLSTKDPMSLVSNDEWTVGQRLYYVAQAVRKIGSVKAFQGFALKGYRCRLDECGPSFASKDLFFFSTIEGRYQALILDSYVRDFFGSQLGYKLTEGSVEDYGKYQFAMYCWAADLELSPSQMEIIVFGWRLDQLAKNSKRNWDPCYRSRQRPCR
jgi:hypothetical protein